MNNTHQINQTQRSSRVLYQEELFFTNCGRPVPDVVVDPSVTDFITLSNVLMDQSRRCTIREGFTFCIDIPEGFTRCNGPNCVDCSFRILKSGCEIGDHSCSGIQTVDSFISIQLTAVVPITCIATQTLKTIRLSQQVTLKFQDVFQSCQICHCSVSDPFVDCFSAGFLAPTDCLPESNCFLVVINAFLTTTASVLVNTLEIPQP